MLKIAIPARYGSSRFPGKPLALIKGKPMIEHVWQRAVEAVDSPGDVLVATDDHRIADAVGAFGGKVVMTRPDHENGTERLAEAAEQLGLESDDIVVNVQGDEPLIDPALIKLVGNGLERHPAAAIATAADVISDAALINSPDIVKVVTDGQGYASYFSRAPIPFVRDSEASADVARLRHIGIYAYRVSGLLELAALEPAPTECAEKLEQLRALWHGMKIHVSLYDGAPPIGVDTQEDIARVEAALERRDP